MHWQNTTLVGECIYNHHGIPMSVREGQPTQTRIGPDTLRSEWPSPAYSDRDSGHLASVDRHRGTGYNRSPTASQPP